MQITEHFTRHEFRCRDENNTQYPCKWIDERLFPLCQALEKIREKVKRPLKITSGYRTKEHNAKQSDAAKNSYHTKGLAVDFQCVNDNCKVAISPRDLCHVVEEMIKNGEIPEGGLGSYPLHVHYDFGPKRRWTK